MAEWAYLVRTHFGNRSLDVRWNMMRVALAAMQVHYSFLSGADELSKGISPADWARIHKHQVISPDEIRRLEDCHQHASRFWLPMTWGLQEVKAGLLVKLRSRSHVGHDALTADDLLGDPGLMTVYSAFESVALNFRHFCSETLEIMNMPVPYAYFHATKLLLLSALMIISYSLIEEEVRFDIVEDDTPIFLRRDEWNLVISLAVYVVISGIMIGLHAIGVRMSDPFGDDDTDFDIEAMLSSAYNTCFEILADDRGTMVDDMPRGLINPLRSKDSVHAARRLSHAVINDKELKHFLEAAQEEGDETELPEGTTPTQPLLLSGHCSSDEPSHAEDTGPEKREPFPPHNPAQPAPGTREMEHPQLALSPSVPRPASSRPATARSSHPRTGPPRVAPHRTNAGPPSLPPRLGSMPTPAPTSSQSSRGPGTRPNLLASSKSSRPATGAAAHSIYDAGNIAA